MTNKVNLSLLLKTLILLLLLIPASFGQQGDDCSATISCGAHQSCHTGRCVCEMGFVRTGPDCDPVRKYGEPCIYDEQCIDHRMSCQSIDANNTKKVCLCNTLHEWNSESRDCVQTLNITVLLKSLVGDDPSVDIMKEADSIFLSLGWAGIMVAVLLVLLGTGLIVYGCCLYECYDKCAAGEVSSQCPPTCVNYKRQEPLLPSRSFEVGAAEVRGALRSAAEVEERRQRQRQEQRQQQQQPCLTEVGLCLDFS